MTSRNTDREVPNQFIIEGDGKVAFQSYRSTIAIIDWNEKVIYIGEDWNYSNTTGKYRNAFFEEFCMDKLTTKKGLSEAIEEGLYFDGFLTWKVAMI